MHYNSTERLIAKILDRYPDLKLRVKYLYQHFNYLVHASESKLRIYLFENLAIVGVLNKGKANLFNNVFFGYYDKSPWSFDMKYYLVHIFNEKEKDKVSVGIYDCETSELAILDQSPAFNFQQGAILRWLNNKDYLIIYNTVVDGDLVAKVKDIISGKERIIPMPVQTVNKDGTEALTLNYKRLDKIRPEYGYKVKVNNFSSDMPYEEDGIWRIDLATGKYELIISLADLMSIEHRKEMDKAQHKINHIMYSPSGRRFVFMHRWIGSHGKFSRLYVANSDGSNLKILADDRMVSHYSWRDDNFLLAYARKEPIGDKYFLINVNTSEFQVVGNEVLDIYGDGHPSYSPDGRWIVTDTYPDKARLGYLILYDTTTNNAQIIGKFFSPWKFDGYYRCDLHPRWSPDGTKISIDSAHEGFRNSYIIDISEIINGTGS